MMRVQAKAGTYLGWEVWDGAFLVGRYHDRQEADNAARRMSTEDVEEGARWGHVEPPPGGLTVGGVYTPSDLEEAWSEWGCSCGPASVAALLGRECSDVRPHFPGFETRRYANPTHIYSALRSMGIEAEAFKRGRPETGLLFIQWGGPWLQPGVPIGAAYRQTHWIAVAGEAVFDVNVGHWTGRTDWEHPTNGVAAWLMSQNRRCDGTWTVRTAIEVRGGR